jgi:REP element-mobilizing transposase RayT
MPRQARLDIPGLLHHVIARGIERRLIFIDKTDYNDFLSRVETALTKTPNQILAWALMPNHFHLLIRSGAEGISRFMRRLMSGYAVAFNHRHKRSGYLFQNRYKSFVCDEQSYLLELVRYIHLNPLRAGIVKDVAALGRYPYSGHSTLMGADQRRWQAREEILRLFGSCERYERFVQEGKCQGRRPELVGGGLTRSAGGREELLRKRRDGDGEPFDARILGGGDFVAQVLREVEAKDSERAALRQKDLDLRAVAGRIAKTESLPENSLFLRGRTAPVSRAKSMLIFAGVNYFGRTTKEMARLTRMTLSAASKARERGQALLKDAAIPGVPVS